jgi:LmbE family N-acetylglucosaminyl deacetylase
MNILIESPHTDDAELGCGGSIIKFVEEGHNILWAVFSTAEDSVPESMPRDILRSEFLIAARSLGLNDENFMIFDFRVRRFQERRQDLLEELVKIRAKFHPDLVLMPSLNDFHQDHQVVSSETVRAFKINSSIIGYELPWNQVNSTTNMFIRLDRHHIERKYNLLENYNSQFVKRRNYFSKEYVTGLARVRGTQCNAEYAEAFEVIRWII